MCRLLSVVLWLGAVPCCLGQLATGVSFDPALGYVGCSFHRDTGSSLFRVNYVPFGSPADVAGIRKGDLIAAIDGHPAKDLTLAGATALCHGPIGSTVTFVIANPGALTNEITITRCSLPNIYLAAAQSGDSRAQTDLAYYYEHAPGNARDTARAIDLYRKAAAQNYVPAQVELARMYQTGNGLAMDADQAVRLYRTAAAQDNPLAERELALAYYNGRGAPQSDKDAFAWFYAAARHDDTYAELYLGYLYHQGRGVPRDDQAAFAWFYRAAERNNAYAAWQLSDMYEHGYGVKADLAEAARWARIAHASLPPQRKLDAHVAVLGLSEFFQQPGPPTLDLRPLQSTQRVGFIGGFVFIFALYFAAGSIVALFSGLFPAARGRIPLALGWIVFYFIGQILGLFVLIAFLPVLNAEVVLLAMVLAAGAPVVASSFAPSAAPFWNAAHAPWVRRIGVGIAAFLVLLAMEAGYDFIYRLVTGGPQTPQDTGAFFLKARSASPWIAASCLALFMPVIEEILFRGYLYDAIGRHLPAAVTILLTAAAFAAYHLQPTYFPQLFGMGLVFGWARHRTGSIRLPIVLHMANNALFLFLAT